MRGFTRPFARWMQPAPLGGALGRRGRRRFGGRRGLLPRGRGFLLGLHNAGDAEDLVTLREREELHALRAAAGLADLAHAGPDALALGRQEHDLAAVAHAERAGNVDRPVLG